MPLTGNILITGGAGTLGHAIARAALAESWDCAITVYSRSELRQAEMRARYPRLRYVLGDVIDYDRLAATVAGHDVVIHAAAMKRIPECEADPAACYQANVLGSANVARACLAHQVPLAIGIGTDKACRASTVYGASKLMMEGIWRAQPESRTRFVCVRYGNVIASNGSVIPLWRQQHQEGKPLTVTDPAMTRFWMAPSEAVDLLVQAKVEPPGTVLIPKMRALNIVAMAQLICPGAQIEAIGLRSTEKLHEDLVHEDEPASESLNYFRIGFGSRGHRYTSQTAPRLSAGEFLRMLGEVDACANS